MDERPDPRIRVDAALDMPTGFQRDIRMAAADCQVVIGTASYFRDDHEQAKRDMAIARAHHQRVIVLLDVDVTPTPGLLPEWAEIHRCPMVGTDMREAYEVLKKLLVI